MTKKEKQIVYLAGELVESKNYRYSCDALHSVSYLLAPLFGMSLRDRYTQFFRDNTFYGYWDWEGYNSDSWKNQRLMALAMFAELEGEI